MDTLGDADISHFIPSVQLTGSRDEKLRKLDTFIRHLLQLRNVLANEPAAQAPRPSGFRWLAERGRAFLAGLATGAAFALLIQAAIHRVL